MRSQHRNTLVWGVLLALAVLVVVGSLRRLGRVERGRAETGVVARAGDAAPSAVVEATVAAPASTVPTDPPGRASTSADEAPEGQLALEVRVYDEREVPIPGARIHAFDGASPLVRTTDEDGRCRLFVRATTEPLRVRAEAAGHVHSSYEFQRDELVEFQLWPAVHVRGRVLAGGDTPVAGARLRYEHLACEGCGPEEIVSGPDGRFELLELPALEPAALAVEAEGHVPIERQEFLLPRTEDVLEQDIYLERGMPVRGRVLDWSTRAGVPGARVGGLVTDADGLFSGHLAAHPGTTGTQIGVSAEGYVALTATVDLVQGELEFRLPRPVTLEGEVTGESGAPLEGASVYVESHGPVRDEIGMLVEGSPLYEPPPGVWYEGLGGHGKTDAQGRFRLPALPWSMNVELRAARRGYMPGECFLARLGEPGTTHRATFALALAPQDTRLSGHVLLNGHPTDARGVVTWRGPTRAGETPFEGHYELDLEPGRIELRVHLDEELTILGGDVFTVDVQAGKQHYEPAFLEVAAATIAGRVRFEGGAPVPHATVTANCPGLFSASRPTDEHGEFRLAVADLGRPYAVHVGFLDQRVTREALAGSQEVEIVLTDRRCVLVRLREAGTGTRFTPGGHVRLLARRAGGLFTPVPAFEKTPDLAGWHAVWLAPADVDFLAQPIRGDLQDYGYALVRGLDPATDSPLRVEIELRRQPPVRIELDERCGPWPEDQQLLLVEEELRGEIGNRPGGLRSFLPGLAENRTVRFDGRRAELAGLAPGRYRFVTNSPAIALDPLEVWIERESDRSVLLRWSSGR